MARSLARARVLFTYLLLQKKVEFWGGWPTREFLAGGEESLDEAVTGRVALDVIGVDVEGKRDDGVAGKKGQRESSIRGRLYLRSYTHGALEVVALAVLDEIVDDQHGDEEDDRLEALEVQSHGLVHDPAEDDKEGGDEKSDLHGAADCDVDGQVHLALVCDDDGCHVFGGVSDDRNQNQTNEGLTDVRRFDDGVDAVDEVFSTYSDKNGNNHKRNTGGDGRKNLAVLIFVISTLLVLDIGKEPVVGVQLEVQVQDVEDEENNRGAVRQEQDVLLGLVGATVLLVALDGSVQSGRDDERRGCDGHERRHGRCDGLVEAALLLADTASKETATQDEQNAGKDAAQHAGLHNADLALLERNDTNDQLDGIAKGRVHKATQGLAKLRRKLLGRKGQQRSKRDDGDEVKDEDGGGVPVERAGDDADGHKDEEDVDIAAHKRRIDQVQEVLGQSGDGGLVGAGGAYQRGMLCRAILGLRHVVRLAEGTSAAVTGDAVEVALYVFCQVRLAKTRRVPLIVTEERCDGDGEDVVLVLRLAKGHRVAEEEVGVRRSN